MNTNTDNRPRNPPAFPQRASDRRVPEYAPGWDDGMTLRDWLAGQIIAALYTSAVEVPSVTRDDLAAEAYHYADAMLRARQQKD